MRSTVIAVAGALLRAGCAADKPKQELGWLNMCSGGPGEPDDPCAKPGCYPGRMRTPEAVAELKKGDLPQA